MIASVATSFRQAHQTIRNNLVLVWFPPIFGTAMSAVVLLMVVLLLQIVSIDAGAALPDILTAGSAMLFVTACTVLVLAGVNAGSMYWQAQAVRGTRVDTGHFLYGVRHLLVRVLAGSILSYLWYAAIIIGLGWPLLVDYAQAITAGETITALSSQEVSALFMVYVWRVAGGIFFFIISTILLSMWVRALALGDLGLWPALVRGVRFAAANFVVVGGVFMLQWSGNLLLSQLLGDALWLVTAIGTHVASVYVSVALMHYYDHRDGSLGKREASPGRPGGLAV